MAITLLDGNKIDGKAIRIGRAFRGWSQRELAQVAGLKPHRVWELENNMSPMTATELGKILGALSTGD